MRSSLFSPLGIALLLTLSTAQLPAQTYKVLHAFGAGTDGGGLWSPVVFDGQGNLYGTTSGGGVNGCGTVFALTPEGDGSWTETILHSFSSSQSTSQGTGPFGGPTFDRHGNLFGTTLGGGGSGTRGLVYELIRGANGWKFMVVHRFGSTDPAGSPQGALAVDGSGNLYGTGAGTAYQLVPNSSGWKEIPLHLFTGTNGDGYGPVAGMRLDKAGNLYGTTQHGGTSTRCDAGCGTAYEIQHQPDGTWKKITLHSFNSYNDGGFPGFADKPAVDKAGFPYATAIGGLTGNGVIFHLYQTPSGQWKDNILYNIQTSAEGTNPSSGVVMDAAGNLYGTTIAGGDSSCDCGVVFKLHPSNGTWTYTVLHRFTGFDGAEPDANLTLDANGNIFGTTATGGAGGAGVVFEITP